MVYSEGFHPKMLISYLPALPLGMEARSEVIEFKSNCLYTRKEFIHQVNKFFPTGIKFFGLKRLGPSEPTLNESIEKMVYSFELKNRELIEAVEEHNKEKNISSLNTYEMVRRLVEQFLENNGDESIAGFYLDEKEGKLYLSMNYSQQKGVRPQKIVEDIFGIKNPVFLMAREKVLFKLTREKDSSIRFFKN